MSYFSTAVNIILLTSVSTACPLCRTPLSEALLIVMSIFVMSEVFFLCRLLEDTAIWSTFVMSEVFVVVVVVVVVVVCRLCRTLLSDAPFIVTSEFSLPSLQEIVI